MDQQFVHFLKHPDLENFLALRNALLAHPGYDPYSTELRGVDSLLQEDQPAEAEALLRSAMTPNHLISPGAHLRLSLAYQRLDRREEAQRERAIGMRCLEGILSTGDGTLAYPYLVTRTSDEYDVLLSQGQRFQSQALLREGARLVDRITAESGRDYHFDVTEIFQIAKGRLSPAEEAT